jgi:hypothetical protein
MSLLIGLAVYDILSNDPAIIEKVGLDAEGDVKIYPIAAPDDVINPFVVYERKQLPPVYTKDGVQSDNSLIIINVCDDSHLKAIEIANLIRQSLELKRGVFSGVTINQSRLGECTEDYGVDNFIQTLNFHIESEY